MLAERGVDLDAMRRGTTDDRPPALPNGSRDVAFNAAVPHERTPRRVAQEERDREGVRRLLAIARAMTPAEVAELRTILRQRADGTEGGVRNG